jgi:hypothetical protein
LAARRDLHEESSLRQPATKELTHAAASAADSGDARTDVADLDEADRDELSSWRSRRAAKSLAGSACAYAAAGINSGAVMLSMVSTANGAPRWRSPLSAL